MDPQLDTAPSAFGDLPPVLADAGAVVPEAALPMPEAALPVPVASLHDVALEPLAAGGETPQGPDDLSLVLDVPVELAVVMGNATMTIRETLAIGTGSIITLNRLVGEPVDLLANGRLIARGEVVAIDEEYGLRVTDVLATPAGAREAA